MTLNGTVASTIFVTITASSSTDIARVQVANTSNFEARLRIRGTDVQTPVRSVGWISCDGSTRDVVLIELRTSGVVGADKSGSSTNAIEMDGISTTSSTFDLDTGSVDGNILSRAANRSFGPMTITGNLRGGITLGTGASLLDLRVTGVIGLAGVNPTAVAINVPGSIYTLQAASIHASIGGATTPVGDIHRIETQSGGFAGSLRAASIKAIATPANISASTPELRIKGDLSAPITLTGDLTTIMSVGESLTSTITLPANGLKGQIIVNANNDAPFGTWTGSVVVGSGAGAITLSPGAAQPNQAPSRLHRICFTQLHHDLFRRVSCPLQLPESPGPCRGPSGLS